MPERRPSARRGFTLVEVLVTTAVAGLVLVGILATNLQLVSSGVRISHYAEMEGQVRRAFEALGRDARIASDIRWNSSSDITLTIPTSSGTTAQATYAWSSATGIFFVVPGASSSATAGRINLVQGVPSLADGSPGVTFARFDRDGNVATTNLATKRIHVSMTVVRRSPTVATASENAVSASFTLRNKPVE
jgi:prepilin-type N-terminal cleavage/methylation domain-containing protein